MRCNGKTLLKRSWQQKNNKGRKLEGLCVFLPRFFFSVTVFYLRTPEILVTAKSRKYRCFFIQDISNKI
jgi:hypothetical protein